jgi:hypothetical protein
MLDNLKGLFYQCMGTGDEGEGRDREKKKEKGEAICLLSKELGPIDWSQNASLDALWRVIVVDLALQLFF